MTNAANDSLTVYYAHKMYHVRYNGKYKTFHDYIDAKNYIESVMMSVWFRAAA